MVHFSSSLILLLPFLCFPPNRAFILSPKWPKPTEPPNILETTNSPTKDQVLTVLLKEVHEIETELQEFKVETNGRLKQLEEDETKANLTLSFHSERIQGIEFDLEEISQQIKVYYPNNSQLSISLDDVIDRTTVLPSAPPSDNSSLHNISDETMKAMQNYSSEPRAFLYDELTETLPVFKFNEAQNDPPCMNLNSIVDAVDTFGTCVVLYSKTNCGGYHGIFQTSGKEKVGQDLKSSSGSVGPCPGNMTREIFSNSSVDTPKGFLYKSGRIERASRVFSTIYNKEDDPSPPCLTYPVTAQFNSIDTLGSCVRVYEGQGCTGYSEGFASNSRVFFGNTLMNKRSSVGPCYGHRVTYDSRRDGQCMNLRGNVKSVNTHDTCVTIYSQSGCQGVGQEFKPGTKSHFDITLERSPDNYSVGPCYTMLSSQSKS